MPKRKRKKIGWMTVVLNATGKDAPLVVDALTIGTMYSGLSRKTLEQLKRLGTGPNPMHPVHPAWGHRSRLWYTIRYT